MRVIISRAFKGRWGGQQNRQKIDRQKEWPEHLVLPGMGLLVLTQMNSAHLRKRKPTPRTGRTFIGHDLLLQICIRTDNNVSERERAFCQRKLMEDNGVMSDLAAAAGQQKRGSNDHAHAGVRKRPEFSEDVKQEQR